MNLRSSQHSAHPHALKAHRRDTGASRWRRCAARAALACVAIAGAGAPVLRAESPHVFGVHFWDWGANVDVMSHRSGWVLEANLGQDGPNVNGRYKPMVGEGFTVIQRLDWKWNLTVPTNAIDRQSFANQCGGWALQLHDYCRHYVIGNEMEFFVTVSEFVQAFQQARSAILSMQPDARVIIGHFNSTGNTRSAMQMLGRDGYDGVATHVGSSVPTGLLDILDDPTLHGGQAARPGVGVYITEWGWVSDSNPNALNVMKSFYENLGASNAVRERQVYCATFFVYWAAGAWGNFDLQYSTIDNPAFEAATALGTSFNSYIDNPVTMSDLYADVPDGGGSVTCSWNTDVAARTQVWWRDVNLLTGNSNSLNTALTTSHNAVINGLSPLREYEFMPLSTRDDYADAGGRRFRVKTGPWGSTATQTGKGRMAIEWQTDWPTDSRVEFGPTPALGQTAQSVLLLTNHRVQITGLSPGSLYYRILSSEPNPDLYGTRLYMRGPSRSTVVIPMIPGDMDLDDDVDQEDFGGFQVCLTGPGFELAPGCEMADLDGDLDVDANDFGLFQGCLGGANVPGDIDCDE